MRNCFKCSVWNGFVGFFVRVYLFVFLVFFISSEHHIGGTIF